jgi:hypothetical protein
MASRRIKSTINSKYCQPLKLRTGRKLVITMSADYNSILFTKKHRAFNPDSQKVKLWAKFNTQTFDGIQIVATLQDKSEQTLASSSCVFKIYFLDITNNWNQTLVHTVNGTLVNKRWIAAPTQANLGLSNELDGERTIMVEATITRLGQSFVSKIYLNHLGIYDSFFRLKEEVEFLAVTKKDE